MQISGSEPLNAEEGGIPGGDNSERDAFYADRRRLHAGFIYRTQNTLCALNALLRESGEATTTDNAIRSMCELFDGDPELPCILLQNPEPSQDKSTFEEMTGIATFRYLREKLQEVQAVIPLEDIPVLDVFPLLTNPQLSRLQYDDRETATSLVFSITRDFIATYKPSRIISMQCHTKQVGRESYWKFRGDFLDSDADALGSSLAGARNGLKIKRSICDHELIIVSSRHPSGIWREGGRGTRRRDDAESITTKLFTSEFVTPKFALQYGQEKQHYRESSLTACYLTVLDLQRNASQTLNEEDIILICKRSRASIREKANDLDVGNTFDTARPASACEASKSVEKPAQNNEISEASNTTPEIEPHNFRDKLRSAAKPEQELSVKEGDHTERDALTVREGFHDSNENREHSSAATRDLETQISKLAIQSAETATTSNDGAEKRGESGSPLLSEESADVKAAPLSENTSKDNSELPGTTAVDTTVDKASDGKETSTTQRIELIREKLADLDKFMGQITLRDKEPLVLTMTEATAEKFERPVVEVVPAA